MVKSRYWCLVAWVVLSSGLLVKPSELAWAQTNRFATSQSQAGYVHWIELYYAQNNRNSPESNRPDSPLMTFGRFHDSATTMTGQVDRSHLTGPLLIDCMLCHHRQGSGYSPFTWTEQIEQENFAYAPAAAFGVATVQGQTRRLKDDFDPKAEGAATQLPAVQYDPNRFRHDGRVLFDLVRKPENNACYYCHTQTAADAVEGQRWWHDEDVHVRAGMACVDCHRNGLDHETARGFAGDCAGDVSLVGDGRHVAGGGVASLCGRRRGAGHGRACSVAAA